MAAFCGLIEQQQLERLTRDGLACEANVKQAKVTTMTGSKFAKVNIGSSGRFMVERETGNIFGIKGYGQVHRGHFYGTIATTGEFFWGDYYPQRLDGKQAMQAKWGNIPALTFAPKPETVDTVCPDGPACADPKCRNERVKQGLPVEEIDLSAGAVERLRNVPAQWD